MLIFRDGILYYIGVLSMIKRPVLWRHFIRSAVTVCSCSILCLMSCSNEKQTVIVNPAAQGGVELPSMPLYAEEIPLQVPENLEEPDVEYPTLSYHSYRVKQGDMIGAIAEQYGLTQDTIISVNNIKQSRLIQIGQYLKLPSMPGILYTVRDGEETIETIAEKYEVSADKCSAVNHISLTEPLSAGTTLFVPDAELDWVTRQEINGDLFIKPLRVKYYYSSYYGWRASPFTGVRSFHSGIDMATYQGAPIYAALAGTVISAKYDNVYGNCVQVRHHSGYVTLYAHMSQILVKQGQYVTTETVLGKVGSTGMSTGPHLHFTVFKNWKTVNPINLWN